MARNKQHKYILHVSWHFLKLTLDILTRKEHKRWRVGGSLPRNGICTQSERNHALRNFYLNFWFSFTK